MRASILAAVGALALTACADPATQDVANEPPPPPARYTAVSELRDAVVSAGVSCPTYNVLRQPAHAAEAAECSDATMLLIFASDEDKQANIDDIAAFSQLVEVTLLVGENWIVNSMPAELDKLGALGGTRFTRGPEE